MNPLLIFELSRISLRHTNAATINEQIREPVLTRSGRTYPADVIVYHLPALHMYVPLRHRTNIVITRYWQTA